MKHTKTSGMGNRSSRKLQLLKSAWTRILITAIIAIGLAAVSCDFFENVPDPVITTVSLPGGTVGTAYSQTLTATGTTPITWSRESGTLPAGLSLAANGTISGTPTTAGTSSFTVKAKNSVGETTKALSIVINPIAPTITTASLPGGTVGTAYSQTLTATGGTPITWSVSAGTLPGGLTLNAESGIISGTPAAAETFNFTVRATNSGGQDSKEFSIIIAPPLTLIETLTVGSSPIGFETDTITLVNGGQPNYWVRGTAAARTGEYSLYITNNGTANAYSITMASVVHAYIDAEIPAGGAFLRFSWRAQGENLMGSARDYLRVSVAPISTVPVAGVLEPTGSTALGTYRMGSATIWGEQVIAIPADNNGTTVRLIFTWNNDSSLGGQPPAAIDNIALEGNVAGNGVTTETKLTVDSPIDFEAGNPLVLVNGLQPNYWMRGTAAARTGEYSLYITNDGTANAYSITMSSVVHAYIDAEIPADGASLKFNWRAQGENLMGSAVDYLIVRVVPTSTVPVAGVLTTVGTTLGTYRMGGAATWGEPVIAIPADNNGTTVRLIFTWNNDSNLGGQPPAAIDNIELIATN